MLNKLGIKTIMEVSLLPMDKVWVGFGSAMCMHGLKKMTKDIDAQCQHDSLEKICQWKKARGREKDMADIKLIEEALR